MGNKRRWLPLVVLLSVLVPLVGCGSPKVDTEREAKQGDEIAKELAAKHQAIILWQEDITYTLQAQERLIAGKPTLFTGEVVDVFHRNGKIFVRLSSYDVWPFFLFELECSPSIVNTVLTGNPFATFAVVANIQDVSRPFFALQAQPFSEDEAEIEVDTSIHFIARGTCLDIAYIGE